VIAGGAHDPSAELPVLAFPSSPPAPLAGVLARETGRLAREANLFLGTSSWKYEGWIGQIYDEERYRTRGRFSRKRFEADCLGEYAGVFPAVCVDAGYYRFPAEGFLARLAGQVPAGFRLCFKVTDEITVKRFPRLPRFGERAGQDNPRFLDAALFADAFLGPLAAQAAKVGVLIFEFSTLHPSHFARGRDFVAALGRFLAALPPGWQYGVEVRNASLLHPDYFAALAAHGVAHVFNSWTRMPAVGAQADLPGAFTTDFFAARFLLRPGRDYREAVAKFSPYRETGEPFPEARADLRRLIARAAAAPTARPSYIFVNNRLEGNSPNTIAAALGC
jgi:uncharacterized protein YecE (DUF72 family)